MDTRSKTPGKKTRIPPSRTSGPRRKIRNHNDYLTDRERRQFSFGSHSKDKLLEKLGPVVRSAARENIRKPSEVCKFLNNQGYKTATGERWTARLAACLLSLLFEDRSRPELSLWNRENPLIPLHQHSSTNAPSNIDMAGQNATAVAPDVIRWNTRPKKKKKKAPAEAGNKSATPSTTANAPASKKLGLRRVHVRTAPRKSFQSSRVIRNLPSMPIDKMVAIWRNALRLIAKSNGESPPIELLRLVEAIEREWKQRQLSASAPDDYFKWPRTNAAGGDGSLSSYDWPSEGLLMMMEYTVNQNHDLPSELRRTILTRIFEGSLPPLISREYMNEWGMPGSATRLQKMANSIASFARNARRRHDTKMDNAISEWESDLRFLYEEFYVGRFRFGWPSTR